MAKAFVQGVSKSSTSSPGTTAALGSSLATGDLVVVYIGMDGGLVGQVAGVTDSKGNTYLQVPGMDIANAGGSLALDCWFAVVTAGGASATVSVDFNAANTNVNFVVQHFNGFLGTPTLDAVHNSSNVSSTTCTSGASAATTVASELVVGGGLHASTTSAFSLGSGYTNLTQSSVSARQIAMESKVVSSTGAQTATFTIAAARVNIGGVVTFYDNTQQAPTVALNSPADASSGSDTTPELDFTGTDADGEAVTYEVQVDTVNTFNTVAGAVIDSYSESNVDTVTNALNSTGDTAVAQSFTGNGKTLNTAVFYMKGSGLPTGSANAIVYAHSGVFGTSSVPTGLALATSGNFNVATLTTSMQLITFTFSGVNQIVLTNATKYVVALRYNGGDNSNLVVYGFDGSSPSASGNISRLSSSWSATAGQDLAFYVNGLASPALDKLSNVDTGFVDITNGADTDPFASGDQVGFTVQAGDALAANTYYWRVRGKDPSGSTAYGAWSSTRSFTVSTGGGSPAPPPRIYRQAVNRASTY